MSCYHASCIAVDGFGVLIRGAPGIGKSDLAIRLLDGGGKLVADDQVLVSGASGLLLASAPETLRGLVEVRGLGIVRAPVMPEARLALIIDLVPDGQNERMPLPDHCVVEGIPLPRIRITPHHASAAAVVRLAVRTLANGGCLAGALGDATAPISGATA